MRKVLKEKDVHFVLKWHCDDLPVRGNALASGDPEVDRQVEDAIIRRLDAGDDWAWAAVTVEAHWRGLIGSDHLGRCSYKDEEEFRGDSYYADMCSVALADLQQKLDYILQGVDDA